MSLIDIRKTVVTVEEIWHEGGPRATTPLRIGLAAAVVRNPYAGRYVEDLMPFMADLRGLGQDLARRLLAALGGDTSRIEAYGKGAIVGTAGELEHGALWHEPGGWSMREVLGGTKAIVPANKMVGAAGTRMMVPLGHVNAAYVRSHFLTIEMGVSDAPRPDEIVYGLAMATAGRIHARAGGLKASDISANDGLR
jgi:hypothetical protein